VSAAVARAQGVIAELSNAGYSYPDGTEAVHGIDLKVKAGARIGVVGPSGCGKSTLLAMLSGLIHPTEGSAELAPATAGRHPLSMVFQKDTVLPWLTVAKNVNLWRKFRSSKSRTGDLPTVEELLALAGLSERADFLPHQLSGGMRRRVAFLTAMAPMPSLLLLDEPFSALDEPTRVGIHQMVFDMTKRFEVATILVTHDLAEALSLCDEVFIMSRGPGTVAHRHEVPFGAERDMLELRHRPRFLELYGQLWDELSAQIAASKVVAT
jgi:NitT/TauT family transport system ATP-binding protein